MRPDRCSALQARQGRPEGRPHRASAWAAGRVPWRVQSLAVQGRPDPPGRTTLVAGRRSGRTGAAALAGRHFGYARAVHAVRIIVLASTASSPSSNGGMMLKVPAARADGSGKTPAMAAAVADERTYTAM